MDIRTNEEAALPSLPGQPKEQRWDSLDLSQRLVCSSFKKITGRIPDQHTVAEVAHKGREKAAKGFNEEAGKWETWLGIACLSCVIDHLRRRRHERELPCEIVCTDWPPSKKAEFWDEVHIVLQGLSARDQAIFHARMIEEQSPEEIAENLKMTYGAVNTAIWRIRNAFKARWTD